MDFISISLMTKKIIEGIIFGVSIIFDIIVIKNKWTWKEQEREIEWKVFTIIVSLTAIISGYFLFFN